MPSNQPRQTPSRPLRRGTAFLVAVAVVTSMDIEVLIVGIFVSAGVLSYVIIPGLQDVGPGARSHGSER